MKEWIQHFWNTDRFARWFLLYFFVLASGFLAHYWVVGQAVYGDGIYYYAFTRSIVKDLDIQMVNEYSHTYSPGNNNSLVTVPPVVVANVTENGFAENKYGIGAPLLWVLPFAFVDTLVNIWNIISLPIPSQGFSDMYQIAVGLFNVAASFVGAVLLYVFLKDYFKPLAAFLAVTLFLFGTNLFYYSSIDVINSHPFSFLVSTVFLIFWWKTFLKRTPAQWFVLGILFGILLAIRTQDVVFAVLIAAEAFLSMRRIGLKRELLFRQGIKYCLFVCGTLLAFLPQLFIWQTIYGNIFTSPYLTSGGSFNFLQPSIVNLFIDPKIGILWWTPVFIMSIVGLILYIRKQKRLALVSLLLILAEVYFISAWHAWHQGESFGVRMLISAIPFMTIGVAHVIQVLLQRFSAKLVYALCMLCILLNFTLILYFLLLHQNPTKDGNIVTQERSLEKLEQIYKSVTPFK